MPSDASLPPRPSDNDKARRLAWLVLNAALIALALWVLREFIAPMVWAGVITIALWPLLLRLNRPQYGRHGTTVIAFVVTLVVGLFITLPFLIIFGQAMHEAHDMMAWIKNTEANGIALPELVTRLPFGAQIAGWWQANLARPLVQSPAVQGLHGTTVVTMSRQFGVLAVRSVIHFGFMLLTLFVLLQTGPRLADQSLQAVGRFFGLPGAQLAATMAAAVRGTVTGLVVVGLGEGFIIGLAYAFANVPHAGAIGLLTAVAAMLPFCAPLVFGATALWLFTQGETAGAVGVLVTGAIVVFVAEHFVRPLLIGSATRLPFLLVLFSILGGAQTFGLLGLFVGPALMTVLVVLWRDATQQPL
ncbi:MAG TPA: AI-2E family transporter [Trinickia sp.]|jgi:predicted PurR-regulated permease PerM|uniref:AI-2E family transporter n=1 Tax=Trinickia sp. TaxID=2571163 RepID=UPI002C0B658D|nr:AI-2E family transporter [Trinickia sp.]HTI18296.1 AI-2E family transporter [Trinickia sp.]